MNGAFRGAVYCISFCGRDQTCVSRDTERGKKNHTDRSLDRRHSVAHNQYGSPSSERIVCKLDSPSGQGTRRGQSDYKNTIINPNISAHVHPSVIKTVL